MRQNLPSTITLSSTRINVQMLAMLTEYFRSQGKIPQSRSELTQFVFTELFVMLKEKDKLEPLDCAEAYAKLGIVTTKFFNSTSSAGAKQQKLVENFVQEEDKHEDRSSEIEYNLFKKEGEES